MKKVWMILLLVLVGLIVIVSHYSQESQEALIGDVTVLIEPSEVCLYPGQLKQFTAIVSGAEETGVIWSVENGGSITSSGLYKAPSKMSFSSVIATSIADPTKKAVVSTGPIFPQVDQIPEKYHGKITIENIGINGQSTYRQTAELEVTLFLKSPGKFENCFAHLAPVRVTARVADQYPIDYQQLKVASSISCFGLYSPDIVIGLELFNDTYQIDCSDIPIYFIAPGGPPSIAKPYRIFGWKTTKIALPNTRQRLIGSVTLEVEGLVGVQQTITWDLRYQT